MWECNEKGTGSRGEEGRLKTPVGDSEEDVAREVLDGCLGSPLPQEHPDVAV